MGQVVTLNYFKHKPNKNFALQPTLKGVYPVHVLEDDHARLDNESSAHHDGMYRDHFFDMINVASNLKCCHKDDISKCTVPLRGVPGVCRYFRTNELDILAETRAGYQPKGFNRSEYK